MAISFNALPKEKRVTQLCTAAGALRKARCWPESVVMEWMALRTAMFSMLERRKISYQGTRDAIIATMDLFKNIEDATDLIFIFHIATLAEWDENFILSKSQAVLIQEIGERIRLSMILTSPGNKL